MFGFRLEPIFDVSENDVRYESGLEWLRIYRLGSLIKIYDMEKIHSFCLFWRLWIIKSVFGLKSHSINKQKTKDKNGPQFWSSRIWKWHFCVLKYSYSIRFDFYFILMSNLCKNEYPRECNFCGRCWQVGLVQS